MQFAQTDLLTRRENNAHICLFDLWFRKYDKKNMEFERLNNADADKTHSYRI